MMAFIYFLSCRVWVCLSMSAALKCWRVFLYHFRFAWFRIFFRDWLSSQLKLLLLFFFSLSLSPPLGRRKSGAHFCGPCVSSLSRFPPLFSHFLAFLHFCLPFKLCFTQCNISLCAAAFLLVGRNLNSSTCAFMYFCGMPVGCLHVNFPACSFQSSLCYL